MTHLTAAEVRAVLIGLADHSTPETALDRRVEAIGVMADALTREPERDSTLYGRLKSKLASVLDAPVPSSGEDLIALLHDRMCELAELRAAAKDQAADSGTILGAWQKLTTLIGRDGTSPASVVDRVAYLAEQAARIEILRNDVRQALGRWHADDNDVPDVALVEYVQDAVRQANKAARP